MEASSLDARVTPLELFFDLVFVFALTQVTALMAADLTGRGILRGVLMLGLLWWSWTAFAWLCNVVKADEGAIRIALLVAMIAMFVLALAIPEAFDDLDGSSPRPGGRRRVLLPVSPDAPGALSGSLRRTTPGCAGS